MSYLPELGQFSFGNKWEDLTLGTHESFVSHQLYYLTEQVDFALGETYNSGAYGAEYQNDTFSMFPYYWGECTCEVDSPHHEDCPVIRPNFRCGNVIINWYKYIGRGMSTNVELTRAEWNDLFQKCFRSLGAIYSGSKKYAFRR